MRLTRVSQLVIVITIALCLLFWLKNRMSNYSLYNLSTLVSSSQIPDTTKIIFNSPMTVTVNFTESDANFTNNTMGKESKAEGLRDFYIGLFLAIISTVFIGTSFIFKKLGLLKLAKNSSTRAGQGGYGYLKEWLWWTGMILMIVGEFSNFAAFAFAPASMVVPLGAISVLVSSVLASRFLKERLNLLGKIGCGLCVLGSTVVVLHSPKEQEVANMEDLLEKLISPMFIVFGVLVIVSSLILMIYFAPRYGSTNVLVYVAICSVLGSFTVMGCKGVGVAIKETISGEKNEFTNWLTWVLLVVVVACILIQLNYLNRALDTYNTSVVTPIYYVFFTTTVIIASVILYKEFGSMSPEDIVGDLCGFFTIICGIFLLNAFKDMNISMSNLPKAKKEDKSSANGDLLQGHLDEDHRTLLDDEEEMQPDEENVQLVTDYRDDPDTFTESYRP